MTVVSSPVQFDDQIDVGDSVQGWQSDVQDQEDQDCLHLHHFSSLNSLHKQGNKYVVGPQQCSNCNYHILLHTQLINSLS